MNHRKLYDIKVKHQWFAAEGADIVVIDTGASAKAEEKRIPAVWHLPAVVILAWLCFLPGMRSMGTGRGSKYTGSGEWHC